MSTARRPCYPSDVTDAEWEFLLPYLTLMREDAPQREHPLRDLFDAVRYVVKTGVQWRYLPHDFPPGRRRTSRRGAGSRPGSTRRSPTTCGSSSGSSRAAARSLRR